MLPSGFKRVSARGIGCTACHSVVQQIMVGTLPGNPNLSTCTVGQIVRLHGPFLRAVDLPHQRMLPVCRADRLACALDCCIMHGMPCHQASKTAAHYMLAAKQAACISSLATRTNKQLGATWRDYPVHIGRQGWKKQMPSCTAPAARA